MSNIYLIQHPEGFHKIGVSKNPQKRLKNIQTCIPYELNIENVIVCDKKAYEIEKIIHNSLTNFNIRGEWFELPHSARVYLCSKDSFSWSEIHKKRFEWESPSDYMDRIEERRNTA